MGDGQADLRQQSSYDLGAAAPECDVVMKGGITSGVVYPRAVCRLATRYRLRSLGGASAGAIAATFAAAAEVGRADGGFVRLDALPDELGRDLGALFQPAATTQRAFDVFVAWVEPAWTTARRVRRTLALVAGAGGVWSAITFIAVVAIAVVLQVAVGLSPDGPLGWIAVILAALGVVLVAAAVSLGVAAARMVRTTLRALASNGFGLCDGHTRPPGATTPPLTDWMAEQLELLAGLAPGEVPLTFGDLWGRQAADAFRAAVPLRQGEDQLPEERRRELRAMRLVDVRLMTTDLTHRRPYSVPFATQVFHWCPACWVRYFPDHVLRQLGDERSEVADETSDGHQVAKLCPHHGVRLRYLPRPPDLPVVVGARLSLSFPGLISAVPLYAVDWSAGPGDRVIVPVWFSDGGIASNFPMHFFDRLWPRRPTFGINLMPKHPSYPDQRVWRPRDGARGILPRARPMGSMVGFVRSIFDTMQNWADNVQITMPGFRDRVVEVRLDDHEGGINLRMDRDTVKDLADRGAEAAAELESFDFQLHRWIRHRTAMSSLDEVVSTMRETYDGPDGYAALIGEHEPGRGNYPAGAADGVATKALMDVADQWAALDHPALKGRVPRPQPSLRPVARP